MSGWGRAVIWHSSLVAVALLSFMSMVISEPPAGWKGLRGFLSAELIQGEIDSLESKTFYTCGPYPVYDFCKVELQKLHIPRTRVKSEAPGPPDDATKETG